MALDAFGIVCQDIPQSLSLYKHLGLCFEELATDHYQCQLPSGIRLMLDSVKLTKELNPKW